MRITTDRFGFVAMNDAQIGCARGQSSSHLQHGWIAMYVIATQRPRTAAGDHRTQQQRPTRSQKRPPRLGWPKVDSIADVVS